MLNGAMPIFAAVLATVLLRRIPRPARLAGLLVGSVGVAAITWSSAGSGASSALGVALILCATLCYGVSVNLAVPLQQRYGAVRRGDGAHRGAPWVRWTAPYGVGGGSLAGSSFGWQAVLAMLAIGILGTGAAYSIVGTLVGCVGSVRGLVHYLSDTGGGASARRADPHGPGGGAVAIAGVVLATAGALLAARRELSHDAP